MTDVTKTKMTQTVKLFSARYIAGTAMLSAIAFVLMYLEIVVPIMPSFIKFDFSDLPALIAAFAYGPLSGVIVELLKNLIHCAFTQSFGVGELSNFLLGAVFALVAGFMYKYKKNKKMAILAAVVGSFAMGIASFPLNLFIVYPTYYNFMPKEAIVAAYQAILAGVKNIPQCLLVFNVPFTIVKGLISAIITMLIYKPLSPLLHGRAK